MIMNADSAALTLLIEERQRRAEVEKALARTQEALAELQGENAELRKSLEALDGTQ